MRLTVLGCNGPWPAPDGACSGYLCALDGHALLLDMGSGVLSRLLPRTDPAALDAVLVSHWHHDHTSDLTVFQYYLQLHRGAVPVYAPDEGPMPLRAACAGLDLRELRSAKSIGPFDLSFCPVCHAVPDYACKVRAGGRTLVYTGDVGRVDERLTAFVHDADLLICDGAFLSDRWSPRLPHISAKQAGELAATTDHARLLLTHYSPEQDADALLRDARIAHGNAVLARPGLQLDV